MNLLAVANALLDSIVLLVTKSHALSVHIVLVRVTGIHCPALQEASMLRLDSSSARNAHVDIFVPGLVVSILRFARQVMHVVVMASVPQTTFVPQAITVRMEQ